ncbi:MAG: type II toxin-antitoxin system VapC family toxin [bacterium]
MYLVDTNIWLELLLEQENAENVREFLDTIEAKFLSITEFSLYSIGVILTRLKKYELFDDFLSDTIEDSGIGKICLETSELKQVIGIIQRFNLDFDDTYQYLAAQLNNLEIVSFDKDFDRTDRGR